MSDNGQPPISYNGKPFTTTSSSEKEETHKISQPHSSKREVGPIPPPSENSSGAQSPPSFSPFQPLPINSSHTMSLCQTKVAPHEQIRSYQTPQKTMKERDGTDRKNVSPLKPVEREQNGNLSTINVVPPGSHLGEDTDLKKKSEEGGGFEQESSLSQSNKSQTDISSHASTSTKTISMPHKNPPESRPSAWRIEYDRTSATNPTLSPGREQPQIQKNRKLSHDLVGLQNLGNTCYMDATLQCLTRTSAFRRVVETNQLLSAALKSSSQGLVTSELVRLSNVLYASWGGVFCPREFWMQVGRKAPAFANMRQHDAQEFLRYLLDTVHQETNRVAKVPPTKVLETRKEETLQAQADRFREFYLGHNDSVIYDLFGGLLQQTRICSICANMSRTFAPYLDISLPLPVSTPYSTCTLVDCLQEFTKSERLGGKEQAYCERCNTYTDSTLDFKLFNAPPILVFHLKRFATDAFQTKIDNKIQIVINDLDLSSFLSSAESSFQRRYNLKCVINHLGTLSSGHYTAYCREDTYSNWFEFDDENVRLHENPTFSHAYVLFYEKAS